MMKKLLALLLTLTMLFTLAACSQPAEQTEEQPAEQPTEETTEETTEQETEAAPSDIVTGMIAYTFGTGSYSDDVLAGLQKAEDQLGIPHYALEIADVAETANAFRTLIQQGVNFVLVSTSEYADGMLEVAQEYPDIKFLYTAEYLADAPENIMSFEYREDEAAFLAGALGGLLTQNNKIGAVLAVAEPLQLRYQYGYTAGANTVNPDAEVLISFTNSYADTNLGYEHANAMYTQGADFVGCYAGACNLGVFQAAEEAGDGYYSFGAANGQFDASYEKIIASVVKPVDEAILSILRNYQETGVFASDTSSLGVAESGVVLLFTDNDALLTLVGDDNMAVIEDLTAKIISGEIDVPGTEEEYNAYSYTYEG